MKSSEDLRQFLLSVDRKGYPAYKGAKGMYRFGDFTLSIDHVQGDPFASPSKVSVRVDGKRAGFPVSAYDTYSKRIALADYVLRCFGEMVEQYNFKARGSGKSGLMAVSRPGQEILERTAAEFGEADGSLLIRMEVGFPANGRTINSSELIKILFGFLPECVAATCFYGKYSPKGKAQVEVVKKLAEDQAAAREAIKTLGLCAFIANGSVLPRKSGVSDRPMEKAIPFAAPASMEVVLELPNRGKLAGMGIKKGVTLIVGGGYHGKSTLLEALERGVYNHIAGDGREYVFTDPTAVKLRAEDGRSVKNVDISLFIRNLPDKRDTRRFYTEDASGSTSQAANVVEAIESGSKLFLVDEDTSATNFMIRDELMQKVVSRDQEPITPFIERVRGLYEAMGISTILVAGSSGAYFHVADCVIQMDCYVPEEITKRAKETAAADGPGIQPLKTEAVTYARVPSEIKCVKRDDRLKMKVLGRDSLQVDKEVIELRGVEQIADTEQIAALGYLLKYAGLHLVDGKCAMTEIVDLLEQKIGRDGLAALADDGYLPVNLALPRRQEIFACFNRCRSLGFPFRR